MRNAFLSLLRGFLLLLVGLFLCVSTYLAVARGILHEPLPMPFGVGAAVVLSGSMEPTLRTDDLVFIRQTQEVDVGDVIVYQEGDHLVVHRAVLVDGQTIVTRGDANNVNDAPINVDAVRGVVVKRLPRVGAWLRAFRTPAGLLMILLLVFLLPEILYGPGLPDDTKRIEAMKEEIRRLRRESAEDWKEGEDER